MKGLVAIVGAASMAVGTHHIVTKHWHPRPHRPHVTHVTSLGTYKHTRSK